MSCSYKIGKLKNYIYLVKDLVYKVIDYKVNIISGTIYKLNADMVTLNETENYSGRFKFNTTVNCHINRVFDDTFIKSNKFKVVIEDRTGMQFLVSPEFDAAYTSEFTITGEELTYNLIFNTQSNIPTRIVHTKIIPTNNVEEPTCQYNKFGIDRFYIKNSNGGEYEQIDFISCEYSKVFNGDNITTQIQFTIPVEDNDWHYNLIKFPSNLWDTKIIANGDEVLDTVLFPSYTRQTQEEIGMPDIFTITLRNVKGGSLMGTTTQQSQFRWVSTEGFICDGFDKYIKESKQKYEDGWVDTGEYRKGMLIQRNSEDCGYVKGAKYRWVTIDIANGYVCVGTNKHFKQEQEISTDEGKTWTRTGSSRAGDLYQVNSIDCGYELIEWLPVDGEYICEEYDPSVSWVLLDDEYYCEIVTL